MKKNIMRISSLVLLAAMLFSFASCAGSTSANENVLQISMIYDENSPYKPSAGGSISGGSSTNNGGSSSNSAPVANPDNNTPATPDNSTPAASDSNNGNSNSADKPADNNNQGGASSTASDPAAILAKYTEITDKMKTSLKSYDKKEFQQVNDLDLGAASSVAQPLIGQFLKTEDQAELQQGRTDPENIPPWHKTKGCLLTDASFIKSATEKDNGDGTATITIVLKDEKNPEPADGNTAPSKTGAMFSPLKKADIDNTLAGIKVLTVNSFDLTYHDCTVTLKYDTATQQVKEITQVMNIGVTASIKVLVATVNGSGTVVNTIQITNIQY